MTNPENKEILKLKLRATIEANKISRLSRVIQDEKLSEFRKEYKKLYEKNYIENKDNLQKIDKRIQWLEILIGIISEKQEIADEAEANRTFASYGGCETFSGGTGCDAG